MGSLQPGIPLLSLLPKEWSIIVIDLKRLLFSLKKQKNKKTKPLQE